MAGFSSVTVHGPTPEIARIDPEVVTSARLVVHARR
jgi:hypothetical protein